MSKNVFAQLRMKLNFCTIKLDFGHLDVRHWTCTQGN